MVDPLSLGVVSFAFLSSALGGVLSWRFVPEGHVAVFYRNGALLNKTAGPGFSMSLPFVTRVDFVQTTVQTDRVERIPYLLRCDVLPGRT